MAPAGPFTRTAEGKQAGPFSYPMTRSLSCHLPDPEDGGVDFWSSEPEQRPSSLDQEDQSCAVYHGPRGVHSAASSVASLPFLVSSSSGADCSSVTGLPIAQLPWKKPTTHRGS